MCRVAFVIPLHEKHYKFAHEFIQSFVRYSMDKQSDLYFILSTEYDLQTFDAYIQSNSINYYYGGGKTRIVSHSIAA